MLNHKEKRDALYHRDGDRTQTQTLDHLRPKWGKKGSEKSDKLVAHLPDVIRGASST